MSDESSMERYRSLLGVARRVILAHLEGRRFDFPSIEEVFLCTQGVFVTLYDEQHELRGCIGHIQGVCETLVHEVAECAMAAAFEDPRFPPLSRQEFDQIHLEISLLQPLEEVFDRTELDPKKFGVVVSSGRRKGLLLPDIEGVNSIEMQIEIARRKAGIYPGEPVKLQKFRVDKLREL